MRLLTALFSSKWLDPRHFVLTGNDSYLEFVHFRIRLKNYEPRQTCRSGAYGGAHSHPRRQGLGLSLVFHHH